MILDRLKRRFSGAILPNDVMQSLTQLVNQAYSGKIDSLTEVSWLHGQENIFKLWFAGLSGNVKRALQPTNRKSQLENLRRLLVDAMKRTGNGSRVYFSDRLTEQDRAVIYSGKQLSPFQGLMAWLDVRVLEIILKVYFHEEAIGDAGLFFLDVADLRYHIWYKMSARLGEVPASKDRVRLSESLAADVLKNVQDAVFEMWEYGRLRIDLAKTSPTRVVDESWAEILIWGDGIERPPNFHLSRLSLPLWTFADGALRGDVKRWVPMSNSDTVWRVVLLDMCSAVVIWNLNCAEPAPDDQIKDLISAVGNMASHMLVLRDDESALHLKMGFIAEEPSDRSLVWSVVSSLSGVADIEYLTREDRLSLFVFLKYVLAIDAAYYPGVVSGKGRLPLSMDDSFGAFVDREKRLLNSLTATMRSVT